MSGRASSELLAMRLALLDQKWHSKRSVIMAGAALIPPVKALQHVEYKRKWKSEQAHGYAREREQTYGREEAIRGGSFLLASKALQSEISRHPQRYELDGEMIRWKPKEKTI